MSGAIVATLEGLGVLGRSATPVRPERTNERNGEEMKRSISSLPQPVEIAPIEDDGSRLLVERAKAGDQLAFRELVERYQQRVFAIAYGVVGNPEDARDIVQDAFVKAYAKLGSFRGQSSFYTWIYRITFNLSVDLTRKRYRHRELLFGDQKGIERGVITSEGREGIGGGSLVDASANPEGALSRGELREGLRAAMQALSPEHRAVITLREIEGLSYTEISDVVGCSKGTVMSRTASRAAKDAASIGEVLSDGH